MPKLPVYSRFAASTGVPIISVAIDTPARARKSGAADALGVTAAVLGAGMLGFGALAYESGMNVFLAMLCTAGIWALPGQIVLIEMHMAGAPGVLTVIAVSLTAARFLPMTLALMPVIDSPRYPRRTAYLAAQVLAMTSWAWAMRRCTDMPRDMRLPYVIGFAGTCCLVGTLATAVGFYFASAFPPLMRMGFVFLNPVYFVVLLIGETRAVLAMSAIACGAIAGPLLYSVNSQWSVPLAGVIGGTAAYFLQRIVRRGNA